MQVVSEGPISLIAFVSNNTVPTVVSGGYINWGVSPHLEVILNASITQLVEYDTFNVGVTSSNLVGRTSLYF